MRLFSFQREHWASYKIDLPTPLIGPLCNKKKVQNMPDNSLHIGPDQKAIPSLQRPSEKCHVDILTKIDGWNNPQMDLRTSLILLWHNDINDEHLLIFPSPGRWCCQIPQTGRAKTGVWLSGSVWLPPWDWQPSILLEEKEIVSISHWQDRWHSPRTFLL